MTLFVKAAAFLNEPVLRYCTILIGSEPSHINFNRTLCLRYTPPPQIGSRTYGQRTSLSCLAPRNNSMESSQARGDVEDLSALGTMCRIVSLIYNEGLIVESCATDKIKTQNHIAYKKTEAPEFTKDKNTDYNRTQYIDHLKACVDHSMFNFCSIFMDYGSPEDVGYTVSVYMHPSMGCEGWEFRPAVKLTYKVLPDKAPIKRFEALYELLNVALWMKHDQIHAT